MSTDLLSLSALMEPLRGFVAVGRAMSITRAAESLCLTQSAVSRQVQALEERLGVQLLRRGHRSLAFTEDGERLFQSANLALRQLQEAVSAISATSPSRPVTLSASIGVTALWLLPQLGPFQEKHTDVDLRVAAGNRLIDLGAENVDLAIRYCALGDAPPNASHMFDESLAPVSRPASGLRALRSGADLNGQVLLEFDDPKRPWLQWSHWLTSRAWTARPKAILRFNQYDQVVHSAMAGHGIALGRLPLLGHWIRGRHLKMLDKPRPPAGSDHAYWLLQAAEVPRPTVRTVVDWLKRQATVAQT